LITPNAINTRAQFASAADYIFIDGFDPPVDCAPALSCPAPQTGKSCISGRLVDAASGLQLRAQFKVERTCADGAAGGPCDLALSAHDGVSFSMNPAASPSLASAETTVDGCGRFRFANLDPPAGPFVMVVSDDANPSDDLHVPSGTPHALGSNARVDGVVALATARDTIDAWTQSAGFPFGTSSFADVGVILFGFDVGGVPRAGVTLKRSGNPAPASDYYFADPSPLQRLEVDATLTSTGIDGAALFAAGSFDLAGYSGAGGEPTGCSWPSVTASGAPGAVVFIQIGAHCSP